MPDTLSLATNAPRRGYDHPRDRLLVPVAQEVRLFSDVQERLVAEQQPLFSLDAVKIVGKIALGQTVTIDSWEKRHLNALGIAVPATVGATFELEDSEEAQRYYDLAGNPELMVDFIEWFMKLSPSSSVAQPTVILDGNHRIARSGTLDGVKGHALALGRSIHPGDWDASKKLDVGVNNALTSLDANGRLVEWRTNDRRAKGRQKISFVFEDEARHALAGLHIIRERPFADLDDEKFHVIKRSESFVAADGRIPYEVVKQLLEMVVKINRRRREDQDVEWLRIDNRAFDTLPDMVKTVMNAYWYSIHHHDSPALSITPISTDYFIRKPEK